MAKYDWYVVRAVVEEEICFRDEESFEHYLTQLSVKGEPYHVINKRFEYRNVIATIRKRYGEYAFIGEQDEPKNPEKVKLYKEFEELRKNIKNRDNRDI